MERRRGFHDSFIRFLVLFLVAAAAALATAAAFAIRVLHLRRGGPWDKLFGLWRCPLPLLLLALEPRVPSAPVPNQTNRP